MAAGQEASWQVLMDDHTWSTVSEEDAQVLELQLVADPMSCRELPLGPNKWRYSIDFRSMTQKNSKSGRLRALRRLGEPRALGDERAAPCFEDVLMALRPFHRLLGGTPHAGRSDPHIPKKLKRAELERSSDYEYVFMTILGFKALKEHGEEIARLNNGAFWKENPATMRVEEVCGFTMHGNREGATGIVRAAPDALLRAFAIARCKGMIMEFFQGEAFDRLADPCLEGRFGRILAFLEHHCPADDDGREPGAPSWEELTVSPFPADASAETVVGEHLRVFRNECIWRWAKAAAHSYEEGKRLWELAGARDAASGADGPGGAAELPDVPALCNEGTFREHLAAVGVLHASPPAAGCAPPAGAFSAEALHRAVRFYVEMGTLSPAPAAPS